MMQRYIESKERKTTYFEKAGSQNTKALLNTVKEYINKEEIEKQYRRHKHG